MPLYVHMYGVVNFKMGATRTHVWNLKSPVRYGVGPDKPLYYSQSVILIHGSIKYNYLWPTGQRTTAQLRLIINSSSVPSSRHPLVRPQMQATGQMTISRYFWNIAIYRKSRYLFRRYDTIYRYRKRYFDISSHHYYTVAIAADTWAVTEACQPCWIISVNMSKDMR